jgi:hypothetical protein
LIKVDIATLNKVVAVLVLLYGGYDWWLQRPIWHGPGVIAPHPPEQQLVKEAKPFFYKGAKIKQLAYFQAEARILSRHDYRWDSTAELSPLDLALGWGPMSDEAVLAKLSLEQSGRWLTYRYTEPPIPVHEIERNTANVHIIPADAVIEKALRNLRVGQVIALQGYLVEVETPGQGRWVSSLSREDTGQGACEILWLEQFTVL